METTLNPSDRNVDTLTLLPPEHSSSVLRWTRERSEIVKGLLAAQPALDTIKKTRVANPNGNKSYQFADIADVLEMVRNAYTPCGVLVLQGFEWSGDRIRIETEFIHASGQSVATMTEFPASKGAQDIGSAITYAKRYQLLTMASLATEDNDAANLARGNQGGGNQGGGDQPPARGQFRDNRPGAGDGSTDPTRPIPEALVVQIERTLARLVLAGHAGATVEAVLTRHAPGKNHLNDLNFQQGQAISNSLNKYEALEKAKALQQQQPPAAA